MVETFSTGIVVGLAATCIIGALASLRWVLGNPFGLLAVLVCTLAVVFGYRLG
jgi:hypothetical protein